MSITTYKHGHQPRRVHRRRPAFAPVALGRGAPLEPPRLDLRLEELAQNKAFACARHSASQRGSVSYAWPRWRIATTRTLLVSRSS